ncbi:aminotransferase class IV [Fimbriiglobus ruber]|uniref:branched-chain-amino-acid transaminase n=1 Tax=Fimbriiglobus ruber TaxID=1908690 RepID=A0A225E375_9BACT|nr:aminotransferase class IV [Fimbriiglobus ruber]OWK43939.1 Branched-chain amino acid aminotransferase [Fimbriiglobus ruber]
MSAKIWIDGKLVDKNDAKVGLFDHGFLFGDGVWEGMRIYGGQVFRLTEHVARLCASAACLGISIPFSPDALSTTVAETVRANNRTYGYVRVIVTRGAGTLGLDPRKCTPSVIVIAEDVVTFPRELYEFGLTLVTAATPRHPIGLAPPYPQTLGNVAAVLQKAEALRAGCLDALVLMGSGEVVGTVEGSLFVVSGGVVRTPPPGVGPPDPVTRGALFDLVRATGREVAEQTLTRADVAGAEEAFIVGTAAEVIAVASLDGRPVGAGREGPVAREMRSAFRRATRGESDGAAGGAS